MPFDISGSSQPSAAALAVHRASLSGPGLPRPAPAKVPNSSQAVRAVSSPQASMRDARATKPKATARITLFRETFGILMHKFVQGSAKRWAPGCVNAAGKDRQKYEARA